MIEQFTAARVYPLEPHPNDFNDAAAIAEAAGRASMRYVLLKTTEQLELQALHRVRRRYEDRSARIPSRPGASALHEQAGYITATVFAIALEVSLATEGHTIHLSRPRRYRLEAVGLIKKPFRIVSG